MRKRRRSGEKQRRRNGDKSAGEDKRKRNGGKPSESRHGMNVQESERRSERSAKRSLIRNEKNATAQGSEIKTVNDQHQARAEESLLLKRQKRLMRRIWKRQLLRC